MQFPKNIFNNRMLFNMLIMTFLVAGSMTAALGQRTISVDQKDSLAAGTTLTQCRNGGDGLQICSWTGGNANAQQSNYSERDYIPYRVLFTGLTPGVEYTLRFGYDVLKGSTHAVDYIGTYNLTVPVSQNDPCAGVAHCSAAATPNGTSQITVEQDPLLEHPSTFPDVSATVPTNPMPTDGKMTIWGGTFVPGSFTYLTWGGGEERLVEVTFIANVENPVLAWGGHIGWQGDWGAGKSATSISGSPYHTFLRLLNGASTGNQDVQLQANAVIVPAQVIIIKQAIFGGNEIFPDITFGFQASSHFDPLNFGLNPSNGSPGNSVRISDFVAPGTFTISEVGMPSNWQILDLQCTDVGQFGLPSVIPSTPTTPTETTVATINAEQGEIITCVFRNTFAGTTAALASVTGRVTTGAGIGISGATMTLVKAGTGETIRAITNPFGYYTFEGLEVEELYILSVGHKRYDFMDGQRVFTLDGDLVGVDFTSMW